MMDIFNSDKKAIKKAFDKVRNELEDHLDTINENTNEIQSNYEFLCELEKKIDKLNERLDNMQMLLRKFGTVEVETREFGKVQELMDEEKKIFVVLYTAKSKLNYAEIASQVGFSEELTRQYLTNLIEKGVPIIKEYLDKKPYVALNAQFKELQAKRSIISLT